MTQISILGCGWLGWPLAERLVGKGFKVKGATTSEDKLSLLQNSGIEPHLITVSSNDVLGEFSSFLENSSVLIINIPPKLRGLNSENFVEKIAILLPYIKTSSIEKVLFVSSTSVYPDNNQIITEAVIPQPDSESSKQLIEAEKLLSENDSFQTTVVRFGGLIGKDRHPIRFLSGKKNIENPNAPINLIHLEDCIGIIEKIIIDDIWNETFNAVAPFHPSRENYYVQKSVGLKLNLPEFDHQKPSLGKTILSDKVQQILGYSFINNTL